MHEMNQSLENIESIGKGPAMQLAEQSETCPRHSL